MFARLSRYDIPGARVDEAITTFGAALEQIREMRGFREAYVLVSQEHECATTLTFWDNAAAMEASRVTASRVRTEAVQAVDGSVTSSQEFEVAIHAESTG